MLLARQDLKSKLKTSLYIFIHTTKIKFVPTYQSHCLCEEICINWNLTLSKDLFYLLNSRGKFQYCESPKTSKTTSPSYQKISVIYLGSLHSLKICMNMCTANFVDNTDLRLHTIIKCKLTPHPPSKCSATF